MPVDNVGLAAIAAGSIFAYAGIKGYSIPQAIQAIVQGKNPASTLNNAFPIEVPSGSSDGTGGSPVANTGPAQQILQQTAAQFGWSSGAEWQALSQLEMAEAGFNPNAKNPSSGALGLAQALGHGNANTAGSLGNGYGGYGLSDAQAKEANSGNAALQALWMCNYIKATYGDPIAAWANHQAHNSY